MKTIWYRLFYPYGSNLLIFVTWVLMLGVSLLIDNMIGTMIHLMSYWVLALYLLGVYLFQPEAKAKLKKIKKEKPKEEKVQEQTSTKRSLIGKILMKTDNWTYEELSSMEEGTLKRKIQMLEND